MYFSNLSFESDHYIFTSLLKTTFKAAIKFKIICCFPCKDTFYADQIKRIKLLKIRIMILVFSLVYMAVNVGIKTNLSNVLIQIRF